MVSLADCTNENFPEKSFSNVIKFINVNYKTDGELTFITDASSGKIIVDCSSSVELNRDIPKLQLTDGTFEWG